MVQRFTKTCTCVILGILLVAAMLAVGLNNSQVSADPCTAQLSYPVIAAQQYGYGSNVLVTVTVSATCSFQPGQLYAVGTAYDTTYNSNVGTANAVLGTTYGGNSFSGQLQFNLPTTVQAHSVQFSVSIYNTQAANYLSYYTASPLTTTSATFVVTLSTYQSSYPYYPTYPYYPGNNYYYGSYPYYGQNPGNYYNSNHNGGYYHNSNNQNPGNYYGNNNHNGGYYHDNSNQNPGSYPYYPSYQNHGNSNTTPK